MSNTYTAAVISLNSESSKMTVEALKEYFSEVHALNIKNIEIVLGDKNPILYEGKPLPAFDCVIVKGSFRYAAIANSITKILWPTTYLPICAESFTVVHDKVLTHIQMQSAHIPMPKTYLTSSVVGAKELLKFVHYPVVLKFPQGTQGKGVMFADTYAAASSLLDAFDTLKQSVLIQEYVETNGEDIRAFVIGNKVVAAMKRKAASGEKRSNLHAGGLSEAFVCPPAVEKIAIETAKAIGAEICGVDILESHKYPVVIEANLSPGLQGITNATGKNIAGLIAKHVYEKTVAYKAAQGSPNAQDILDGLQKQKKPVNPQSLFGTLDWRGNRILLPEAITKLSSLTEHDECTITIHPGKIEIKKGL
ncbi:MAG: ATP-grasp domain-containing protein [Candidatus Woesearchaeota archaeon]